MKNYVIQSGNFTEAGNFTGYTALGVRVHIHKNQMESKGWDKAKKPSFPFYAIGEVKQIGQLDENGQPKKAADGSALLVDRLTAMSVFGSKEELIKAQVDERTLDINISAEVAKTAVASGLSTEDVKALLAAAV